MEEERKTEEEIQQQALEAAKLVDFTMDPEELKRRKELLQLLESREDF